MASYTDTRKVRNILIHREVALLRDNRTSNLQGHVDGFALNASGNATMLEGERYKSVGQLLLDRNPTLEALMSNDNKAVFSVGVFSYVFAKGYASVYELQLV